MPRAYTAEDIIASVRAIGDVPDTGVDGATDADLLRHANEGLLEDIYPDMVEISEDYFIVSERQDAAGGPQFRLPERAMWQKLRHIKLTNTEGVVNFSANLAGRSDDDVIPVSREFVFEGNYLKFFSSSLTGYLEWAFYFRPGELVLSTECRQVASVAAPSGGQIVVTVASAVPTAWETAGTIFDCHSAKSGAEIKVWEVTPPTVSGTSMTFTEADIDGSIFGRKAIAAGDWICLEGEAALPGIPLELHPLVARNAAARYAESVGEKEERQYHEGKFDKGMAKAQKAMNRRIESKPKRIKGRRSILRSGRISRW